MDFSSSVARRTRSQKALYLRADYENRKNSNGGGKAGLKECSGRKSVESITGDNIRVRKSRKLEGRKEKEAKHAQESCICVPIHIDSEEDEVTEVNDGSEGGKGGEQNFDSASLDNEDPCKTDKKFVSVEETTSSSEDGDAKGKDNGNTYDANRDTLDDVAEAEEEKEEESGTRRGLKRKGSSVVTVSDSANCRNDKETEDNVIDSDFSSVEESTSSSEDEEDDVDTSDLEGVLDDDDDYDDEESTSVGDADEEINDITNGLKRQRFDEDGNKESSVRTRRRMKSYGVDVSVPVKMNKMDKENATNSVRNSCVAHRTRSNFKWDSSLKKRKKQQFGTVTDPICFDVEGIDSSSESRTDDDEDHASEKNGGNDTEDGDRKKLHRKAGGDVKKHTEGKSLRGIKSAYLIKLLADTILKKGQMCEKELNNSEDETVEEDISTPIEENSLPLKFSFGIIKSKPKEKSDHEKEMDQLWTEMDFVLSSSEIGSFATSMVDNEVAKEEQFETDLSTSCQFGKHHFILDEQIGIICRLCSFVMEEIKYVLPPMTTSARERSGKNNAFTKGDFSRFDGFEFPALHDDFLSSNSNVNIRGTVWDRFPRIREKMYPHQQEGFELMWRNLAGSTDLDVNNLNCSKGVGGCVISHAPGTGKTFLTIAFLYTYMGIFKESRPLVIAPCSMLLTWEEEFKKWNVDIPFYNLNTPELCRKENRAITLYSWSEGKGILGISYSLFEKLAGDRPVKDKDHKKQGKTLSECIRNYLLEMPSLLVLDEGHTARNTSSGIWKALKNIKTERRIILSGTPFQNNLRELFNMLWLVRPTFADKISCKTQKIRRRPSKMEQMDEARGKWDYLTNFIGEDGDDKLLGRFRTLLEPFVHVHGGSILQQNLPGLKDCVVVLKPPPLQKQILEDIQKRKNSFELEHVMSLVSVHPSLLTKCSWLGNYKTIIEKITAKSFKLNPNEGVKTRFIMELIRLSDSLKEKVLVFSQYVGPFPLIKDQLHSLYNWTEGREVLQMDGKLDMKVRQTLIKRFNDPYSEAKVLLASTKACREGINLVGASRIVLLDVVWNPSVERQAISRAYRLGQKKVVYTYHLITSGTKEADKFCVQMKKDNLSKLVFSADDNTDKQNISSTVSHDKILQEMLGHNKLADMFDDIIYQPKESELVKTFGSVTSNQTGNGT